MNVRTGFELLLLAAIWGGSFLFIRYAAPDFGVFGLIWMRVAVASALLVPLVFWRGEMSSLFAHFGALVFVGVLSAAIPFALIAWALLSIDAGVASILNASTPIFTALVGVLWLQEQLSKSQWVGLFVGFVGVAVLAENTGALNNVSALWAVLAMLGATLCYGMSTHFTKRYLAELPALVNAAGSQLGAALVLWPLAWWSHPSVMPKLSAWGAVLALAVVCTAFAYLIFFRLIAQLGASKAVTVTFLIPLFGVLWGVLFLQEQVSFAMLLGGGVILVGTALATGVVALPCFSIWCAGKRDTNA